MGCALRLRSKEVDAELRKVPGWRLQGKRISSTFVLEDFEQVISFVNRLAKIAEQMNHHPDLSIRYNKIRVSITTHDEGGLTRKDFQLARRISSAERL